MKLNIKLKVTPEQSEAVQKICFVNGINWKTTNFNKCRTDVKYIFINPTNLTKCPPTSEDYFKSHPYTEVDADLFIKNNGTCEESIELVDNSSNSKSKEDMFKQYGFEAPDFDCELFKEIEGKIIGVVYKTSGYDTETIAFWWDSSTGLINPNHSNKYDLTPIKKPWYETCKFPVLAKNMYRDGELIILTSRKKKLFVIKIFSNKT